MSAESYRSNDSCGEAQGKRYSVRTGAIELSAGFDSSLAPPYPRVEDEQKKDIAILMSSLAIRESYIDDLRKTRDSLQAELDLKEAYINSLKDSLRSYEASFKKARIRALLRKDHEDFSDQKLV
jgi:hypothetical protein